LDKDIPEYFDLDRLRNVVKLDGLKLKTLMHLDCIKHHGTKEQKQRAEKAETKAVIEAIYKEVLKDVGQGRQ
jgi:hypothetical protein